MLSFVLGFYFGGVFVIFLWMHYEDGETFINSIIISIAWPISLLAGFMGERRMKTICCGQWLVRH